jgi:hypothetical protein
MVIDDKNLNDLGEKWNRNRLVRIKKINK